MEIDLSLSRWQSKEKTGTSDSDQALAMKIAAGDADAWDRFFDRYSAWVYRFAFAHLSQNKADAEDLSSDVMLVTAKSIGKFDPRRGDLDAWVFGIARHRLARFCRKRRIDLPLIPDLVNQPTTAGPLPVSMADSAATRDVVNRALASLPERQAAVLVAKYVQGYTTDELAQQNGVSVKAVESLLVRARSAFRSTFNRLMNGPGGEDNE